MLYLTLLDVNPEDLPYKHSFSAILDGTTFLFDINYIVRSDRWYITLYDSSSNVLVAGKKMVVNYPLFDTHVKAGMPKGQVMLLDTAGTEAECGHDDFSNRCKLIYLEDDEGEFVNLSNFYEETLIVDVQWL